MMRLSVFQTRKTLSFMAIFVMLLSNLAFITPTLASNDVITVDEAIQNNTGTKTVEGFIVGFIKSQTNVTADPTEFTGDTNLAIASNNGETNIDNMLFVQIPKDLRAEFGLKSNPDIIGKKVQITGSLEEYFKRPGLKNPTGMIFVDENDPTPDPGDELTPISMQEARAQGTGEVKVKGVVTAKLKNTIHIQDETGALAVRPPTLAVEIGEEITVSGVLQDYRGLLQLDKAIIDEKHGKQTFSPTVVTGEGVNKEENESKLVIVKNVSLTDDQQGNGWVNFTATDGITEFMVRDENDNLELEIGKTYDSITGIITQFDDGYQIIPRSKQDIVADKTLVQPVYATPAAGKVPSGTIVELKTLTDGAKIFYTLDGSEPSAENGVLYEKPIEINHATTVKAVAIKAGLQASEIMIFEYTVYDGEKGMQIHDIQGDGHESPLKGTVVQNIEGVVTYQYDIRGSHYFHLQAEEKDYDNNPNTSEAIIIYTGKKENITVGDRVKVAGKVDEYHIDGYDDRAETDLSITQINARDDRGGKVTVLEKNIPLPEPITITSSNIPTRIIGSDGFDTFDRENNAIDFWESIEGMRVEVAPSKAVAPQAHGDLVVVTEEFPTETIHGGIRLKENQANAQFIQFKVQPNTIARGLKVKTGDRLTEAIVGVVNYGFQNYKIYADLAEVESVLKEGTSNPQQTKIVKDMNKLTIAAYNVENFSANTSETSREKAENIARAIVHDMGAPDVVGLIEMQDNNGTASGPSDADASQSFVRLIDAIEEANGPTYDYVNVNPEYNKDGGAPNSNIRVGFIYNPTRVSLQEGQAGTANEPAVYKNKSLSLNPGRISPMEAAFMSSRKPIAAQFSFQDESFIVVANHLNSKRGDQALFGKHQPPQLLSESQRIKQASLINDFVKEIVTDNPEENIIVLGDMNDFEFSTPLKTLKGQELTNMIDMVPENERYTYVFQGNSQVLDHILVSNHLAEQTDIDILHVNADFTPMHGRASDHDPVLAQIDLKEQVQEVVAPVVASPGAGEVESGTKVTLLSDTEGATIYYTLDGTVPTEKSMVYEQPIEITEQVTIKAIAVKEGWKTSELRSYSYSVVKVLDTTPLVILIQQAKEISNADKKYTEKSFALLQSAIKEAEEKLVTMETKAELTDTIAQLQQAITGLVVREVPVVPEEPGASNNTGDVEGEGSNGNDNGEETLSKPEGQSDETKPSDKVTVVVEKEKDGKLPNTSTMIYTFLLIGSLLLLVGTVIFAYRKHKIIG